MPVGLEHFTLGSPFRHGTPKYWTLSAVLPAITHHKSTLRTLNIGIIGRRCKASLGGFDLTDFENLEELTLSPLCTGTEVGHEDKLLAPRLRKFTWQFPRLGRRGARGAPRARGDRGDGTTWNEFLEEEGAWISALAMAAVDKGGVLREIVVDFFNVEYFRWGGPQAEIYPWEHIDRVAAEVRAMGIAFEYPPAFVSRDMFYRWPKGGWLKYLDDGVVLCRKPRVRTITSYFDRMRDEEFEADLDVEA